ncbi:MAG: type VI secretion system domain-containing protein [Acidobacteria bacterium]|nr:type VI secretion system domain-containing protein [Acidobacteriota bacterium]
MDLLSAEIARQPCGRDRFRIRLQLADICLRAGYTAMAKAILEELVQAMDQHRLEDWESPESLARVLAMLYRCLETAELDPARKADLYSRICRLAPHHAEIR